MANIINIALRAIALLLRFMQWAFAIITLAFAAKLLWVHDEHNTGPHGRLVFTLCWAATANVLAFLWLVTFIWTWTWPHYVLDLIASFGFFSSFAALTNWIHRINCGRAFVAFGFFKQNWCNVYRMTEAGAFISGAFWLFHALLSCFLFHLHRKRIKTANKVKAAKEAAGKIPTTHRSKQLDEESVSGSESGHE